MTTNTGSKTNGSKKLFAEDQVAWWLRGIAIAVTVGTTSAVTATLTAFVIILVLVGGLLLAYTYLPMNAFLIVLAVIFGDVLLGVALRAVLKRRKSKASEKV